MTARKIDPQTDTKTKRIAGMARGWGRIVFGLAATLALAGAGAYLLALHLSQRPVDMTSLSVSVAEAALRTLEESGISRDAVQAHDPRLERAPDGKVLWLHQHVEARLPDGLTLDSVEKRLAQALSVHNVRTSRVEDDPGRRVLRLGMGGYAFLDVALVTLLPSVSSLMDRRQEAREAADAVEDALSRGEFGPVAWTRDVETPQENGAASWTLTRFAIPAGDADAARRALTRLAFPVNKFDVHVMTVPEKKDRALVLGRDGMTFVEIVCAAPQEGWPNGVRGDKAAFVLPEQDDLPLESSGLTEGELVLDSGAAALPKGPPRIAIILDDGGYGGPATEAVLQLDPKLTLSILPHTPYGAETARRAAELGFEVMLHMPMQNGGQGIAFPGMIRTTSSADEIAQLTYEALAEIPEAVGVNNHTGSRFTADAQAMGHFLKCLQQRDLFFVDSRTSPKSMACAVARDLGVPVASRNVFLDNKADPAYIAGQIEQLIQSALKHGHAIGIGHFRPLTAQRLPEELEAIKQAGIELVHASELVE